MPAPFQPQTSSQPVSVRTYALEERYCRHEGEFFLTGIQAMTKLPILRHTIDQNNGHKTAGFISGYRGSPIGGLDQALWQAGEQLRQHHIVFQPGINEDLGATAVWGSQQVNLFEGARYDGVFGLWYGKGPGLNRSGDAIKHANAAGTSALGGVLALVGDEAALRSAMDSIASAGTTDFGAALIEY